MSNTVATLFPDEPRPQSQNCTVDISGPWNYWRPYGPQITWIGGMPPAPMSTAVSTTDEPCDDEELEDDEEENLADLIRGMVHTAVEEAKKDIVSDVIAKLAKQMRAYSASNDNRSTH
jgi:hypothetical protein